MGVNVYLGIFCFLASIIGVLFVYADIELHLKVKSDLIFTLTMIVGGIYNCFYYYL